MCSQSTFCPSDSGCTRNQHRFQGSLTLSGLPMADCGLFCSLDWKFHRIADRFGWKRPLRGFCDSERGTGKDKKNLLASPALRSSPVCDAVSETFREMTTAAAAEKLIHSVLSLDDYHTKITTVMLGSWGTRHGARHCRADADV